MNYKLVTNGVCYTSVRTAFKEAEKVPDDAVIVTGYSISSHGEFVAVVRNPTSEIMTLDLTKSFFINTDGMSQSYYDPTIKTSSSTDYNSSTTGASVNLGAVAGAFGVGGAVGRILDGVNVGGSNTDGVSTTNTTYEINQPILKVGPKGMVTLPIYFPISKIGRSYDVTIKPTIYDVDNAKDASVTFSVVISYSMDGGQTYDKIETDFYVNSRIKVDLTKNGIVNNAVREILINKPDALSENWFMFDFISNLSESGSVYTSGAMSDYK